MLVKNFSRSHLGLPKAANQQAEEQKKIPHVSSLAKDSKSLEIDIFGK